MTQRYQFMQDGCHWYLMPVGVANRLNADLNVADVAVDHIGATEEAWDAVRKYRIDGDPENYTIADPVERTAP